MAATHCHGDNTMPTPSTFRQLHHGSGPLLLPNAWDAGSARLIESLGAPAIATTSAGVCWAQGYADGSTLPVATLVEVARNIARVVKVPLTVDMEAGYSDDPAAVAELAARLMDAGAVGVNLEDGASAPELLCAKAQAIKAAAAKAGVDLYINARTDVVLRGLASADGVVDEVLRRAALYRAAGCDGLFVPGLKDLQAAARIAAGTQGMPLNLMLVPGLPPVADLYQAGVRRLSAGSGITQSAMGHIGALVSSFLAGDLQAVATQPGMMAYGALNKLFG
jgi:2-methylisocitrate lyase-like PEP mutase family enzyme